MQETAMILKTLAAAAASLCLTWGGAYAGADIADSQPRAASPGDIPEAVGSTNDTIVREVGPMQGGPASAEDAAAMQMLLLQLLMMQSMQSDAGGGETPTNAPPAPTGTAI
jgi:hypothetical protein